MRRLLHQIAKNEINDTNPCCDILCDVALHEDLGNETIKIIIESSKTSHCVLQLLAMRKNINTDNIVKILNHRNCSIVIVQTIFKKKTLPINLLEKVDREKDNNFLIDYFLEYIINNVA